jgi:hypothetical protein
MARMPAREHKKAPSKKMMMAKVMPTSKPMKTIIA